VKRAVNTSCSLSESSSCSTAWLDAWSGLGAMVAGLREHSHELTLIHDKNGWGRRLSITTESHFE